MHSLDFWTRKRVLVTGHTGFKGGWLSVWLHQLGADVSGYALPAPTDPSLFEVGGVADVVKSTIGDIRDLDRLQSVMAEAQPEIVIHMAAQALVRRSYVNPVETYEVNVMGTVNLLEAARRCDSVRAVVVVTSDKCYENKEWAWGYRESDPMGGYDPYSSSKGCAELVVAAYRRSFFSSDAGSVGLATVRAGNVIGGGDWAEDRLVPDLLRSLESERPIRLRAPGAIRPWQHVLEPLGGYLLLAERLWENPGRYAQGWNFGPGEEASVPVSELADRLISLWNGSVVVEHESQAQPHEASYLTLDTSQARKLLGWRSRVDLTTALEWTVEWFENYRSGKDMQKHVLDQIARYQQRLAPTGLREQTI